MTLFKLMQAYSVLLDIPPTDSWRIANQDLYSRLLHDIALRSNADPESVQNLCEAVVRSAKGKD